VIQSWSEVLSGVSIFIDPGHGGENRGAHGPAEDVFEADVNLRVALHLKGYLVKAGARVLMSREEDRAVSLHERYERANLNNARLFIAIHHNAANNPYTNYTATFYHGKPGTDRYKPSSSDLARYIQRDLSYAMGTPGPLASFDGTMPDYLVHTDKGFAVLRETDMTAALVECSFCSSEYEEQRLAIEEFNEIEAWGIFLGIARYLKAGIPTLRMVSPTAFSKKRPGLEILVTDRSDILDESIRVYIDRREEGFSWNRKTGKIAVKPGQDLAAGYHHLTAHAENSVGNSSAPFELFFTIGTPPVTLRSTPDPAKLPPGEKMFSMVRITAVDSSGHSVPDGLPVRFTTSTGTDTILFLENGFARAHLYPGNNKRVTYTASNGPVKTEGVVTTSDDAMYTRGLLMSIDGKAIASGQIRLSSGNIVSSTEHGEYIIAGINTAGLTAEVLAPGYFGKTVTLEKQRVQYPVLLNPVAGRTLFGKTYLLGIISTSDQIDPARVHARVFDQLKLLLEASGARVIVLPPGKSQRPKRKEILEANPDIPVLQIGEQGRNTKMTIKSGRNSSNRRFGERIMRMLPSFTSVKMQRFVLRMSWSEEIPRRRHTIIYLPLPGTQSYETQLLPLFTWNVSWALYSTILASEGYSARGAKEVTIKVVHKKDRSPAPFVKLELNHALQKMSDTNGVCRFRGVTIGEGDVRVLESDLFEISSVVTEVIN